MFVVIEVTCDNEAFSPEPQYELGAILQKLATNMTELEPGERKPLYDSNGNKVGQMFVYESFTRAKLSVRHEPCDSCGCIPGVRVFGRTLEGA